MRKSAGQFGDVAVDQKLFRPEFRWWGLDGQLRRAIHGVKSIPPRGVFMGLEGKYSFSVIFGHFRSFSVIFVYFLFFLVFFRVFFPAPLAPLG